MPGSIAGTVGKRRNPQRSDGVPLHDQAIALDRLDVSGAADQRDIVILRKSGAVDTADRAGAEDDDVRTVASTRYPVGSRFRLLVRYWLLATVYSALIARTGSSVAARRAGRSPRPSRSRAATGRRTTSVTGSRSDKPNRNVLRVARGHQRRDDADDGSGDGDRERLRQDLAEHLAARAPSAMRMPISRDRPAHACRTSRRRDRRRRARARARAKPADSVASSRSRTSDALIC